MSALSSSFELQTSLSIERLAALKQYQQVPKLLKNMTMIRYTSSPLITAWGEYRFLHYPCHIPSHFCLYLLAGLSPHRLSNAAALPSASSISWLSLCWSDFREMSSTASGSQALCVRGRGVSLLIRSWHDVRRSEAESQAAVCVSTAERASFSILIGKKYWC